MVGPPLVSMTGIDKWCGGVHACDHVNLQLHAGEVLALMGENGAGKSTLMRVLAGDHTDYAGTVRIQGQPVRFANPAAAARAGIAMIHQELDLVPGLSIADNLFLGREPRRRFGGVDRRRAHAQTRRALDRIGVDLDPTQPVGELRVGQQQLVAVARALVGQARVIIMDEPTSALTDTEVRRLFDVIDELRQSGAGVVYISHRMEEIGRIADRAVVLRNGRNVAEFPVAGLTARQAAEAMVGGAAGRLFVAPDSSADPPPHTPSPRRPPLLSVADLAVTGAPRGPAGIDLAVHAGEIVGVCGLLGSGRTELLETLYGLGPAGRRTGRVLLDGRVIRPRGPRQAIAQGIALVPEDRRGSGLVLEHSVLANTVLSALPGLGRGGLVRGGAEQRATAAMIERLRIRSATPRTPVLALSGGNQQKVVFGRALLTRPRLLLLDEPTRGVDIGAKAEIYQLLRRLAADGVGILLASSELAELLGVCQRVVVLRAGRQVAEFDTAQVTEAELLAAAMGQPSPVTGGQPR